jgi:TIR domain
MSQTQPKQPVCFVSMPFGKKRSPWSGVEVDFDEIYATSIQPAVQAETGICVRADEDINSRIFYKPIFSRLIHSELVIADLTMANPNVLYEVGIRHAARSRATILVMARGETAPFDLALFRSVIYDLDQEGSLTPASAVKFTTALRERIREAFNMTSPIDSPLFLLLDDFPGLNLAKVERAAELFFSYARADAEKVQPIYDKLRESGYAPWMDSKDILPGERWETKINQAIKKADFFLAFLSGSSVDRRGVLRKEVRLALGKWQEMLEDDIYLIPIRLEPCEIPEELAGFQTLDVFGSDWWHRLVLAVKAGMEKRTPEIKGA